MSIPGKIVERLMRKYPGQSTEVALRYLPVVHILRQAGVGKVKVGSGSLGLMPFSGILSRLNYGGCYRTIAVIDLSG
jgi:hypothetical protein